MASVTKIHQGKQPIRRHFLAEWMEVRGIAPSELTALLNGPERSMDQGEIDKTQVYRWLKGQMPQPRMQLRLASILGFEDDPGRLLRHPDDDWIAKFFRDRSLEELNRMKTMLEAAFPKEGARDKGKG